jgi:hypothetical protein
MIQRHQQRNLVRHGKRAVLRLFEHFADPPAMLKRGPRGLIEPRAKPGKRF